MFCLLIQHDLSTNDSLRFIRRRQQSIKGGTKELKKIDCSIAQKGRIVKILQNQCFIFEDFSCTYFTFFSVARLPLNFQLSTESDPGLILDLFYFLRPVICLENSRLHLSQSDANFKLITT